MSILISALNAHQILLANASSNVANMNTEDYRSIRTTITSPTEGSVDATTIRAIDTSPQEPEVPAASDVDPPKEFVDMIRARRGFEAILGAISAREEMLDDLMNTFSGK
ncbi:MAG: flagellar basal body rod C-terminal domain-containing protein [Syntrophaceae bacterium]|nr:flagellar basal body protein [Deltaproteobacteria bacterium]